KRKQLLRRVFSNALLEYMIPFLARSRHLQALQREEGALTNKSDCKQALKPPAPQLIPVSFFLLFPPSCFLFFSSLSPPLLPPPSISPHPPGIKATSPSQVLLISPVALADTVDMHSKLNSRLINKAEAVCPTGRYFFICLQPSPADDSPLRFSKGTQGHRALATQLFFLFKFKKNLDAYKKKSSCWSREEEQCALLFDLIRALKALSSLPATFVTDLVLFSLGSKSSILKDAMAAGTPKSILLSASIKREGDSPTASPHSSDDIHHSDRYQTFLRVRANRQTRLNARIGKMKRRKQDEGQREGSCMTEDDSVDIENENGNRFEEYEWCGQKRIRATTLLEGGFRGSGFIMCSGKENPDSDADLDVDGDDTLEYGKPQYTEADIIPCTGEEPGEAKEREALRGAVLNGGTPSTRITPEFSKWASDEMPSTSNGESSKQETMQKTCKNSDIEKITEDSAVTTFEALKARVRELERQLSRGDRYKCLICMDSYTMPLTSIQCWHVHCEECWLRTLGAKKLCPQCNTITSPGDLRRIYL
ncbi:RN220 ligase, partial [Leptocoma aspasia]|nr:RN220 ligase [Leptocoma aspasia]